jgi:RNA polymerase sigma factor (sigma-70 family)
MAEIVDHFGDVIRKQVYSVIRPGHRRSGDQLKMDREDATNNAVIALMAAVKKYDTDSAVAFEVVAARRIRDAVIDTVRPPTASQGTVMISLGEVDPEDENWEPADAAWHVDFDRVEAENDLCTVRQFVYGLPPKQREIVRDIHWHGKTQADVARMRGISRAAVTQTLNRVYREGRQVLADLSEARPLIVSDAA